MLDVAQPLMNMSKTGNAAVAWRCRSCLLTGLHAWPHSVLQMQYCTQRFHTYVLHSMHVANFVCK